VVADIYLRCSVDLDTRHGPKAEDTMRARALTLDGGQIVSVPLLGTHLVDTREDSLLYRSIFNNVYGIIQLTDVHTVRVVTDKFFQIGDSLIPTFGYLFYGALTTVTTGYRRTSL